MRERGDTHSLPPSPLHSLSEERSRAKRERPKDKTKKDRLPCFALALTQDREERTPTHPSFSSSLFYLGLFFPSSRTIRELHQEYTLQQEGFRGEKGRASIAYPHPHPYGGKEERRRKCAAHIHIHPYGPSTLIQTKALHTHSHTSVSPWSGVWVEGRMGKNRIHTHTRHNKGTMG